MTVLTVGRTDTHVTKCGRCPERIGTSLATGEFRVELRGQTVVIHEPVRLTVSCRRGHWNDIELTARSED